MLSSQRPINFTRCFIKHHGKYHFAMFEEGIDCFRLSDKNTINYNHVEIWLSENDHKEMMDTVLQLRFYF